MIEKGPDLKTVKWQAVAENRLDIGACKKRSGSSGHYRYPIRDCRYANRNWRYVGTSRWQLGPTEASFLHMLQDGFVGRSASEKAGRFKPCEHRLNADEHNMTGSFKRFDPRPREGGDS